MNAREMLFWLIVFCIAAGCIFGWGGSDSDDLYSKVRDYELQQYEEAEADEDEDEDY